MRGAIVEGQLVPAGSDAPEEAVCPACGGAVRKRKRRTMDGQVTYFYRHERETGEECPLRYHPCRR
jgi:uncharacterized protein with PIN domain